MFDPRRRVEIINLLLALQQAEEDAEHPDEHRIGLLIDARVAVERTPEPPPAQFADGLIYPRRVVPGVTGATVDTL
jgi:hypothetical protein